MSAEDGTLVGATIDWLEFKDPASDKVWRVPLSFMVSNWMCLFGQGCPGHVPKGSQHTYPDAGCCSIGTLIAEPQEIAHTDAMVKLLTPEDWDDKLRAIAEKKGHFRIRGAKELDTDDEGEDIPDSWFHPVNTRVVDRACIFSNRENGSAGKPGCAFVAMGLRTGKGHHEVMPPACWQLPFGQRYDEEDDVHVLVPWDRNYFGGQDENGSHDAWMQWWCVDAPDAYISPNSVYLTLEVEIRTLMGNEAYEEMRRLIEERKGNVIAKMPGQLRNEGRPMLPLIVEGLHSKNGGCPSGCGAKR